MLSGGKFVSKCSGRSADGCRLVRILLSRGLGCAASSVQCVVHSEKCGVCNVQCSLFCEYYVICGV